MKKVISYTCLAVLCTFMLSCESESKPEDVKVVEKAIEETDVYERYGSSPDILGNIYEELLKTDTVLAKLEGTTNLLLWEKDRLEKPFKLYDRKNNIYYENAKAVVENINDSLLKKNTPL
ncbi:hypothetical protein [Emticicia agri]|uniref:Uncharacterized protein n=1 Tax=Emticicia agri TaxID=2492393 RepID=A0A4Q5M0D0_9BACT|nr:hypothetical protein [Emticicia agri]RYU95253.1 hypothetical protein EWM59_12425 [Emticicia agri]